MTDYPPDWNERRKKVLKRDGYECQNCGAPGGPHGSAELHVHHIVPKSSGGSHKLSNLTTECRECHNAIHHDTMANDSPQKRTQTPSDDIRNTIFNNIEYVNQVEDLLALVFADYDEEKIPPKPPIAILSILSIERRSALEDLAKFESKNVSAPQKLVNRYKIINNTMEAVLNDSKQSTDYRSMITDCFEVMNRSNRPPKEVQESLADVKTSYSGFIQIAEEYMTVDSDNHKEVLQILKNHKESVENSFYIIDQSVVVTENDPPEVTIPDTKTWELNDLSQESGQLLSDLYDGLNSAVNTHKEYLNKEYDIDGGPLYDRLMDAKLYNSNVFSEIDIKSDSPKGSQTSKETNANQSSGEFQNNTDNQESTQSNWPWILALVLSIIVVFSLILF